MPGGEALAERKMSFANSPSWSLLERLALGWMIALVLVLLAGAAWAQQGPPPVQTTPGPATSKGGNASSTIGTGGGTFQQVFAATGPSTSGPGQQSFRKGCLIQNNGSHVMWVTEGLGTATSTEAKATQVQVGGSYNCETPAGVVLTGEIDITGTSGEAFYAAQY